MSVPESSFALWLSDSRYAAWVALVTTIFLLWTRMKLVFGFHRTVSTVIVSTLCVIEALSLACLRLRDTFLLSRNSRRGYSVNTVIC